MKVLGLDLSTKCGYAVLTSDPTKLVKTGLIRTLYVQSDTDQYPDTYINIAADIAVQLRNVVAAEDPDLIVIEETNKGKNRYTQKILEFIHCCFLTELKYSKYRSRVRYINTSDWRKITGVEYTAADKKQNSKLSSAKRKANKSGKKLDKKELGIRGRITKKHVSVRTANARFGLDLKVKDNDIADAICVGLAAIEGKEDVRYCDGK